MKAMILDKIISSIEEEPELEHRKQFNRQKCKTIEHGRRCFAIHPGV